jgi:DNA recombination protein RmuC
VVLASPTNLIALLYAVAHGWQQQRVADGALEIWQLGQTLYDRVRTLVGHFENLRRALDRATEAYNDAVGSLEARVLATARRFHELGTSTRDELPSVEPIARRARRLHASDLVADDERVESPPLAFAVDALSALPKL